MNDRLRRALPLVALLLLGVVLALRFLGTAPDPRPIREVPVLPTVSTASPAPVPGGAASPSAKPEPRPSEPTASVEETPRGTVVPLGPGDVAPLPEVAHPLPQQNDPIEPEKPQTAAWRYEKLVRLTEVLGRDVERLEQERQAAESRGDTVEARRLVVQLSRHRARLGVLREESAALAEAARQEEQAP